MKTLKSAFCIIYNLCKNAIERISRPNGFVQCRKRANKVLGGGGQLAPFASPCGRLCVRVFKHQLQFRRHQNTAIDEIFDVLF